MGTTADKLQNILNAKNAIKEKFSIGDDVKFIDYADNINAGSGGIVVPENFSPASPSDVLLDRQFFNCRGELVSGLNNGIISFDIMCCNLNGTIPEKYMDLVGWYNKIAEDTLSDGTIYERIVQYPNTTKRYVFEHYSLASLGGWVWELQDEQNSLFVSGVSAEPVEIWEAKNWRPAVSVHPDLEGAEILIQSYLQRNSGSTAAADFYLCGYVNRNYFSYNTIVVSGMPTNLFVGSTYMNYDTWESAAVPEDIAARDPNGTYTLQNPADEYGRWWWKSENGCIIDKYDMGQPIIYPDENYRRTDKYVMVPMNEATYSSYDYPVPDDYTSYTWQLHDGSTVSGGSAVVPKPAEVEKYWEGYKLVLNDEGKYDLAAEKTKLTYADYMPVAGRIYDVACTLEITNANLSDDALWACPHGMTSNENDEWVITASSVYTYNGIGYPWHAFDEDNGTKSQTDYVKSNWLQWQNKNRAVVAKRIVFYLYDQNDLNTVSYLQGSDDGEHWTDIVRGQVGYPNEKEGAVEYVDGLTKVTRDFKGNAPCYKYWRLGRDSGSNFRLVIHKIEAFSQIPREVPK